jgi:PAS domain S-box-containing protein
VARFRDSLSGAPALLLGNAAIRVVAASLVALAVIAGLTVLGVRFVDSRVEARSESQLLEGAKLAGLAGDLPELTPRVLDRGISEDQIRRIDRSVAEMQRTTTRPLDAIALIDGDGTIAYSTARGLRGARIRTPELRAALRGTAATERTDEKSDPLDLPGRGALQAYVPLRTAAGGVFGVLALTLSDAPIERQVVAERPIYLLGIAGIGLLLWLLLLPVIVRVSKLGAREYRPGWRSRARALRRGIQAGELEARYHPKVDVANGRLVGAEALVRWRRNGDLMPPADFLALAEESSLIEPLTDVVLDQAVAEAARWHSQDREIGVAVNLSPRSVCEPSLPGRVEKALARHRLPAHLLCLEITENALIENTQASTSVLGALAKLGVRLSLDDFGTGYSSLTRASLLPLSELKIDRSFIGELGPQQRPVVAAMIAIGKALDLEVVAEGVEDLSALVVLRELGCDVVQGYYFTEPLTAEEFDRWRSVARAATDGVGLMLCEANFDGYLLNLRGPWSDTLGYSVSELTARPYLDLVHPEDRARTEAAAAGLADGPSEVIKFENRYRTKSGGWRRLQWAAQSDRLRIYAIACDVTESGRVRPAVRPRRDVARPRAGAPAMPPTPRYF